MFLLNLGTFWNTLQDIRSSMFFDTEELLAISISINVCVTIYCIVLRIQKNCVGNCCCKNENVFGLLSRTYESKPHVLSKFATEQLTAWILSVLSVVALATSGILKSPFDGKVVDPYKVFVPVVIAANIGRYIYMLLQDLYLLHHLETSKYRTDTIHHIVTCICYSVFLVFKQNYLLAMIGITMELSNTIIEVSKIAKELGKTGTVFYKRLTLASCIFTIVFRGVIPVIFLITAMFVQTPFAMHYTVLTVFFLSIIFFSVINVWLILTTIQRLVKTYCGKLNFIHHSADSRRVQTTNATNEANYFTKNNLGYMRRYDNKNLCYIEEEKLNTNKKMTAKDNLPAATMAVPIPEEVMEEVNLADDPSQRENNSAQNRPSNSRNSYIVRYEQNRNSDRSSNSGSALIYQTNSEQTSSGMQGTASVNI